MDPLVSTEWLANEMAACDLRVVDASYFLAEHGRDAAAEYAAGHIPGAVFLDLATLVDSASPVSNTLPSAEKFASRMQALGIGDGSRIVLYDNSPLRSATRAWFMLTMFGAHNVAILDGGLQKWTAEGRPLAKGTETRRHRHFTVWQDRRNLRNKDELLANVASGAEQVVDARSAARFSGAEPEANPALASGHIPGAVNIPYASLFNPDHTWRSPDELRAAFRAAGVDIDRPVIASCGSGITANVVLFSLHLLGKTGALYDGSWSEWGLDPALPKAQGELA